MAVRSVETCIGIRAICLTCDWKSEPYLFCTEGGENYARTSAVIETRLGHINEKAREENGHVHEIRYVYVTED